MTIHPPFREYKKGCIVITTRRRHGKRQPTCPGKLELQHETCLVIGFFFSSFLSLSCLVVLFIFVSPFTTKGPVFALREGGPALQNRPLAVRHNPSLPLPPVRREEKLPRLQQPSPRHLHLHGQEIRHRLL